MRAHMARNLLCHCHRCDHFFLRTFVHSPTFAWNNCQWDDHAPCNNCTWEDILQQYVLAVDNPYRILPYQRRVLDVFHHDYCFHDNHHVDVHLVVRTMGRTRLFLRLDIIRCAVQGRASAGKRTMLREADLYTRCHCREENKLREARLCKGCRRREANKLREAMLCKDCSGKTASIWLRLCALHRVLRSCALHRMLRSGALRSLLWQK